MAFLLHQITSVFWATYFFNSGYFSTTLASPLSLPPVGSVVFLSKLVAHLQGISGLWSFSKALLTLLRHLRGWESLEWEKKSGCIAGWVIEFLKGCLEPESGWWGNSNGCLAPDSPVSSKTIVRMAVTTGKVKYVVFSFIVLSSESYWVKLGKLVSVHRDNGAQTLLWVEPFNHLGGKN